MHWKFVKRYGKVYVAPLEKPSWVFHYSKTEKKNWIYIPELNVYRCNISAL